MDTCVASATSFVEHRCTRSGADLECARAIQDTWDDDWEAPAALQVAILGESCGPFRHVLNRWHLLQAFTLSLSPVLGPAVEREWNLFTAKMIRLSGARVVPLYFPGSNSRWYQIANQISPTLRQSLLIHEIVNACGKPQRPIVGKPFDDAEVQEKLKDPRACMAWMRETTLSLKG